MLSISDLKHHCRTCLMKLNLNACSEVEEPSQPVVVISKFPVIEQLIHLCLRKANNLDAEDDGLDLFMPNICEICFAKWSDFASYCQELVENHEELKKIVDKDVDVLETTTNSDQMLEHDTPNNTNNSAVVEYYDTMSPFYQEDLSERVCDWNDDNNSITNRSLHNCSTPLSHNRDNLSDHHSILEGMQNEKSANDMQPETTTKLLKNTANKCQKIKKRRLRKTANKVTENSGVAQMSSNDSKKGSIKKVLHRCEPCKKYFYGMHKYEAHMKQVHEGIRNAYQCKLCSKAYRFYKNLHDHIALNHSDAPFLLEMFKCDECNKAYKTKVTLQKHLEAKHQNLSKSIICDQCGFIAVSIYGLNKHIKNKHSVPDQIKCDHCPKVFKNPYYLKYHTLNFHNPMDIRPFKCADCNMSFTRIALLNAHKRTHLKISERIKCDYEGCEVRFLFNGEKTKHMRLVHLKVKQHVCDICGEAFGTAPTLRHHRYIHTGEKPFTCSYCGQKFRQRSAMRTHQKTHESKMEEKLMDNLTESEINLENILI